MSMYATSRERFGTDKIASTTGDTGNYIISTAEGKWRSDYAELVRAGENQSSILVGGPLAKSPNYVYGNELVFTRTHNLPTYAHHSMMGDPAVFSSFDGIPMMLSERTSKKYKITSGAVKLPDGSEPPEKDLIDVWEDCVKEMMKTVKFVGVTLVRESFKNQDDPTETKPIAIRTGGVISIENTCTEGTEPGDVLVLDEKAMALAMLGRTSSVGMRASDARKDGRIVARLKKFNRISAEQTYNEIIALITGKNGSEAIKLVERLKEQARSIPICRVVKGGPVGGVMEVSF